MPVSAPRGRTGISAALRAVITEELPENASRAVTLVGRLLAGDGYDQGLARRLFTIARDRKASRRLRCLASLGLEHQFRLALSDQAAILLGEIGVEESEELVRARIARNEAVHRRLRQGPEGLRAFLRHTRRECRLFFARYAFTPAEVVAAIRAQTRATPGKHDFPPLMHPCNVDEAALTMASLPAYERKIVQHLIDARVVYWVDASTPSSPNALVEYPAGTVVLVIKPPGSDVEIEIKRAGLRGEHALDVRYRDETGKIAPLSHHLWGGSRADYLRFEAANSALLARVFRIAQETEAPIPRVVTMSTSELLPTANGGMVSLLGHFGASSRRAELTASLARLTRSDQTASGSPSKRFLKATMPAQAILVGTTSFRLDRLCAWLSEGAPFDGDLDELLDEIIDDYEPPPVTARDQTYVATALAHNRAAADRTYVSIMTQIGRFWGAVLGMRGGSAGESFVLRNVGLRRVFQDGRWRVRFISMDHDSMTLVGRSQQHFDASKHLNAVIPDLAHILGGVIGKRVRSGEVGALQAIYRVSPTVAAEGLSAFRSALRQSYARTLYAMATDPRIRDLFHADFIDNIREWDRAVIDFARSPRDAVSRRRWRHRTRARLHRRGLPRPVVDRYVNTIVAFDDVLRWFVGIYEGGK